MDWPAREPASETRTGPPSLDGVRWIRESREPGRLCFRVGRSEGRVVAEWEGVGLLWASPSGGEMELIPEAGLDPVYEEKWRRGLARGLLRHLEGRTTLHASAVAIDARAVLFLGESGAGKSTCAAHVCGRLAAELLADDTVELEVDGGRLWVAPTERDCWLLRDAAEALGYVRLDDWKAPVPASRAAERAVGLGAIVVLAFEDDLRSPTLSPLRGVDAFSAINDSYVRFVFDDPAVALRDLDAITDVVAAVPVVRLTRSRSLSPGVLDECAKLIGAFAHQLGHDRTQEGGKR